MIIGITGAICSGKSKLVEYLIKTYGFEALDILTIFKLKLTQELRKKVLDLKQQLENNKLIQIEEQIESEDDQIGKEIEELERDIENLNDK